MGVPENHSFTANTMKTFVLVALFALIACAFAQMRLDEVADEFQPLALRGFAADDAHIAPCGQGTNQPVAAANRITLKDAKKYDFIFTIIDAYGGGVVSGYYGVGTNPNPLDFTFADFYLGAFGQIQDYGQARTYSIRVKTPEYNDNPEKGTVTAGDGTIQLVYSGANGMNSFQCVDINLIE